MTRIYTPSAYTFCGCWFLSPTGTQYLPQVELQSHTTILATTSRTVLNQTFINPTKENLKEASYTFPLYDGVSAVGFRCTVAGKTIVGLVKEKSQARAEYKTAVKKGQTAGLFEQSSSAADIFTTSIGNIPAGEKIHVEITYLGELKNDAETDGARFTIPTNIAPRYGNQNDFSLASKPQAVNTGGIKITVDVQLEQGVMVRGIQSPSHPIAVTMGRLSTHAEDMDIFESHLASSTLTLGSTELDKDFIVIVQAKGQDTPRALLETNSILPNHRVLMTTLVPKFNIPNEHPEIVFVVDRSGSMSDKMHLVTEALKIFLKSLPVSVKFNICSFGSNYTFLFERSRTYDAESLQLAMNHITFGFGADYGGTEMVDPVRDVLKRRYKDIPLEIMLLTDGEIYNQQALFDLVNTASEQNARFFTLGIGSSASSSLVEGVARAGKGFSQWVNDGERIDKRIVRMLKAALMPHIDYRLEVVYRQKDTPDEEDFEIVESFQKSLDLVGRDTTTGNKASSVKSKISLFNPFSKETSTNPAQGRYDYLPEVAVPNVLQAPHAIPQLYPHSRFTIYLMLGPESCQRTPSSIILRGSTTDDELELEIPVQDVGHGTTFHQLAAKKAMQELEEGRGWLNEVKTMKGTLLKSQNESKWDLIVEREAVRLGTTFQIGGKFCSFVAVEENQDELPAYELNVEKTEEAKEKRKKSAVFERRAEAGRQSGYGGDQFRLSAPAPPAPSRSAAFAYAAPRGTSFANIAASSPSFMLRKSAPAPALAPSGGLFGGAPPNAPGGSFGSLNSSIRSRGVSGISTPSSNTGGGLFGSSNTSGGLFGSSSVNKTAVAQQVSGKQEKEEIDEKEEEHEDDDVVNDIQYDVDMSSAYSVEETVVQLPKVQNPSPLEKMQKLIGMQMFAGPWEAKEELLVLVSGDAMDSSKVSTTDALVKYIAEIAGKVKPSAEGTEYDSNVCATLVAIAWLERVVPDEEDVWEMVVEKARSWLEGQIDGSDKVESIIVEVKKLWKK